MECPLKPLLGGCEMSGKGILYWDSCIFIAYLKNEVRNDPLDMKGIDELVLLFDMGQVDIYTSTITIPEILQASIGEEVYKQFSLLYSKRNFHLIDVTRKIAEISQEIRSHYYISGKATVETTDSIHLATAVYCKCEKFYTFDGEKNDHQGLLNLNLPLANHYDLKILKPRPKDVLQMTLEI